MHLQCNHVLALRLKVLVTRAQCTEEPLKGFGYVVLDAACCA
jgi:hypothetical protein